MKISSIPLVSCFLLAVCLLAPSGSVQAALPSMKVVRLQSAKQENYAGRRLGSSVAVSDRYAAIGEPAFDLANPGSGAVHVFNPTTGALLWVLKALDAGPNDGFGSSVAISGNILAVGADFQGTGNGRLYNFDLATGKQLSAKGSGFGVSSRFGKQVVITDNHMVTGVPGGGSGKGGMSFDSMPSRNANGSAFVFSAGMADAALGYALYGTGSFTFAGAPGEASIYAFFGTTRFLSMQVAGVDASTGFGTSITGDGLEVIAAAPLRSTGAFIQNGTVHRLRPPYTSSEVLAVDPAPASGRKVGELMACEGSLLVCTVARNANVHDLVLFDLTAGVPLMTIPSEALSPLKKITSLALSEGRLLVGVAGDDVLGSNAGAAFLVSPLPQPNRFTSLLSRGDTAPGFGGIFFNDLGDAAVTSSGLAIARSSLTGPGANRNRDIGVYSQVGNAGWFSSLVKSRQEFGSDLAIGAVQKGLISNHNALCLFQTSLTGAGVNAANRSVLMRDNGMATTQVMRTGQTVPGGTATLKAIRQVTQSSTTARFAANITARQGVAGVSSLNDSAITLWTNDGMTISEVVEEGAPVPMESFNLGEIQPRLSYHSGGIFFSSALVGGSITPADNAAVFRRASGGALALIARKGASAPVPGASATYSAFLAEGGSLPWPSVRALIKGEGVSPATSECLFLSDGMDLKMIARKGDGIMQSDDIRRWAKFLQVWPMGERLLVRAVISGRGINRSNNEGLYLYQENQKWVELVRKGAGFAGQVGAKIGIIQRVEVSPTSGHYCILAAVAGRPAAVNQVLLRGDVTAGDPNLAFGSLRLPSLLLAKGRQFTSGYAGSAQLTGMNFPSQASTDSSGMGRKGLGHVVSNSGAVLVRATFSDGSTRLIQVP